MYASSMKYIIKYKAQKLTTLGFAVLIPPSRN